MNKFDNYSNEELQTMANDANTLSDFLKQIGYGSLSGSLYKDAKLILEKRGIITNFIFQIPKTKRNKEEVFILNSQVDQKTLRKFVLKENFLNYKCAICGLPPIWNDKPLTLTLDHINGNNKDNRKENLRWICPNCDRQLPTFGSKNHKKETLCIDCGKPISRKATRCQKCANIKTAKIHPQNKSKIIWPTIKELELEIKNTSYEETAKKLGVNSNTIRAHLKKYGAIDE